MATYGNSHGSRETGYTCPILLRWLAREVPLEDRETYNEAMIAIDELIPHIGERSNEVTHGRPTPDQLPAIELIEQGVYEITGLTVQHSRLFRYQQDYDTYLASL
jgi:hypothetical protein